MKITPIAARLIEALRHDDFTRRHFSMGNWGSRVCGTVGCLAGTAVLMQHGELENTISPPASSRLIRYAGAETGSGTNRAEPRFGEMIRLGAQALGIADLDTAYHLFVPWEQANKLRRPFQTAIFDYLPTQARPPLDTVEEMIRWAKFGDPDNVSGYTPDRAAFALERIARDGVPYCNWAEAFEKA